MSALIIDAHVEGGHTGPPLRSISPIGDEDVGVALRLTVTI